MRSLTTLLLILWTAALPLMAQARISLSPAEQALLEASYEGKLDSVRRAVTEGVSVNTADGQQRTPLMWAAFNGHTEIVGYLLANGAKLDAKDSAGRTALMYSASGPYAETVELLLNKGADVNVQGTLEGFTALMTAAAEGQLKVVRLLLAHGADRQLKDKDGDTAESFASQKGHTAVVALLQNPPPAKPDKS